MIETELFAFYGSLRKGMSNHAIYANHLQYVESIRITGFTLYALEAYPYAVRSGNNEDSIVIEIFRIIDPTTRKDIYLLELDAGYIFKVIEVHHKKIGIYLFEAPTNNIKVESGDWVEFFGLQAR